jgi:rhodanese-related sulfurtransferase
MPIESRKRFRIMIRPYLITMLSLLLLALCPAFSIPSAVEAETQKPAAKVKLAHPETPRIPAKELVHLIKSKADIVIVDAQAPDGYEMWHIPSAVNIPYIPTEDPMNRQLKLMALPVQKLIVIYCLCEEGTDSAKMAIELLSLGYSREKVRVLEGGLVLWDEKGYPMAKQKLPE